MKRQLFISLILLSSVLAIKAQNLNTIDGSGFNIATGFTPLNAPENTVILGLQSQYDINYKWQLVNAYMTDNYYLRRYVNGIGWGNYNKIWHSGNLSPFTVGNNETNLASFTTINGQWHSVNPSSNTLGAYYYQGLNFGFDVNNYVSLANGVETNELYFGRWAFGWKGWNKVWHSGNLNRNDIDFNCKNLFANGNLWAKEIKVALTNPWADFVFKPNYKLMSLNDLELFIKQKGHLPEMPQADQVKRDGINIGEIQTKLLQKIEEQTLYIIELNKEIQELKRQMAELKK